MKKYIEVNLSLIEKIKVFFFNIIPEEKLPNKDYGGYPAREIPSTDRQQNIEQQNINNNENDFNIPFFDFDQDDKKSNF